MNQDLEILLQGRRRDRELSEMMAVRELDKVGGSRRAAETVRPGTDVGGSDERLGWTRSQVSERDAQLQNEFDELNL
jgi:hypothetical protein